MNHLKTDVVVIGGGAAGMISSCTAAENGKKVIVFDTQKFCGKKLRITGKGRCNVTNNCEVKTFIQNVPSNGKFLYSALNGFSPADTISYFEKMGVPLKTERGNRVFPVSDNAHDVAKAFERKMKRLGIRFITSKVNDILTDNGAVCGVVSDDYTVECESVIICTGGKSYPLTGSTGDGYRFARKLGHTVTDIRPSLVPLASPDAYCEEMQGFSLRNVKANFYDEKGKLIFSELGEMMFTHFGITGPLVLSASAHMRDFRNKKYHLEIDLKPALDEAKLDARILRDFEKYSNRDFANALVDLAGKSMIPVIIELSGIPENTKVHSITRQQRQKLLEVFKRFPVRIEGPRGIDEAIVTSGGVCVKEIDPRTMQSKIVNGLFFAGEVIDVDAYTGGFNLQIAWSTGYTAGKNA